MLEHLARDQHPPLLERVAENPRTHFTTLARLSTHGDSQVRASVAENPNASIKTVWRLARDASADVRLRLAESYTVPVAVLRVLAEDGKSVRLYSRAKHDDENSRRSPRSALGLISN